MYPARKLDVDKHVQECLKKMNNPTERHLRGLSFAKQYYKVGSFEDTRRHINAYLSVRPNSAEAHRLLGQTYENLGKKDAALQAYNTSLRLDPKQNNLVIKVCELLAADDVEIDQSGAAYFCELAQSLDPNNPAIFNLKQRLLMTQNDDPREVSNLLLKELETHPTDIKLRIRLLKHLLQHNLTSEAYKHALEIESKNLSNIFQTSFAWYETVAEVLVKYQRHATEGQLDWEFWFFSVAVLEQLSYLSLCEHCDSIKSTNEYVNAVFNFDQTLSKAVNKITQCPDQQLLHEFVTHYKGQVCFHLVILLYKQAQRDLIDFKEACNITLPLLFTAYNSQPPDLQSVWFNHATELTRDLLKKWRKKASFRLSQVGHLLAAAAKDKKTLIMEQALHNSREKWRENLFKKAFVSRDHHMSLGTSYFVNEDRLNEIVRKLPEKDELLKYDEEAQLLYPDSLHHHIWLVLQNKPSDIKCTVFEGLQYSIKHLKNCGAETLNVLDLQAFIYAASICAKQNRDEAKLNMSFNFNKPNILPSAITQELCTQNQKTFFSAAYKMYKNEYEPALDQLRTTIVEAIKIIRCVDSTPSVHLLVQLANIFVERSRNLVKQSEIEANETRAELYWKIALPLLEKMKNNQMISSIPNKLFTNKFKDLPLVEICAHIENGKLFMASLLMKKKEYERALSLLEPLRDPYASFYQAQIYKDMAGDQMSQNKEHVTSEMRSQNIILLSRSRDCLYLTLDRLREPSVDQKHPLNAELGTEIEKIERLLSRIDSDLTNRNDCDLISDDRVSSPESAGEHYLSTTSFLNGTRTMDNVNHSTPYRSNILRTEARPSPERLDAQLRQLSVLKDYAVNHIVEHNKSIAETNKTLIEELKHIKEAVGGLTTAVNELKEVRHGLEELKDIKKTVSELKTTMEDLDSLKTVSDMVYEMRREMVELKRDVSNNRTAQLSEEDIYGLANEYANEYNLGTNLPTFNPPLFPNYQARLPNPVYGPNLYPGMYPPMYYGGLPLPQTFPGQEQLPINLQPAAAVGMLNPAPVSAPNLLANQHLFRDPKFNLSAATPATTKAPPVNVVITTSDPVPSTKISTSQPVLSVTIPAQHIKSNKNDQPHIFQIPLPTTTVAASPSVLSAPPPTISTKSLLSNVAPPIFSAVSSTISIGSMQDKSESSLNTSNVSTSSLEEHDPCPDFKPIVPLPDEVPVNTGEENETVLFSERAKLYRFTEKEWKERGVGVIKILKNPASGKIRILMRRDQVHKICANHFLTGDMALTPMVNNDKAFIWAAHDFADEAMVLEKFCVRFKSNVEAEKYRDAFLKAQKDLKEEPKAENATLGGFVFSTPPSFKSTEEKVVKEVKVIEPMKNTSFANLTFNTPPVVKVGSPLAKLPSTPNLQFGVRIQQNVVNDSNDDEAEEFVPTAEFKPVMSLPELVDLKTGEEDCDTLFESRAKLLRFDTSGEKNEWKERGVGIMKILKSNTMNTVRLVMRRDQVHKVCCNHQLIKDMIFKKMSNDGKAVTWCAKDFSEGVLKAETFAIKFKNEDIANTFVDAIVSVQRTLDDTNSISTGHVDKHVKHEPPKPAAGFGDKFKPAKGSWECKNCFVVNQSKDSYCVACETPKNDTIPKKEPSTASGSAFSFGVPNMTQVTTSWGKNFGPKDGEWECKDCYTRNAKDAAKCLACEAVNPDASVVDKPAAAAIITQFTFGIPTGAEQPKPTWECKKCSVTNTNDLSECAGCQTSKDAQAASFSFGAASGASYTFGKNATQFVFGQNTNPAFSFATKAEETPGKFVFGSPQKHEFEFTPRSPRITSSSGQKDGEESDNGYAEEEEDNIYFKPVIPLPDKVEVKTGEEEEHVLYCHRAKLYRFINGEWKERGVGDIKILKKPNDGKMRVLMRRELVHKICLNHLLSKDVKYYPKDGKTWLFHAADFSEGELSKEQFCVRFKDESIAGEFMEAVNNALDGVESITVPQSPEDGSDVEIISETKVTPEEEKEALNLQLPPKFMAYRQLPDCDCSQCQKDDEYLKDLLGKPNKQPPTPGTQSNSTIKGLLAKPSLIVASTIAPTTPTSVFPSFTFKSTPETTTATSTLAPKFTFSFASPSAGIFGGAANNSTPTTGKIFGGATTVFQSPTVSTPSATNLLGNSSVSTPSVGNLFATVSTPSATAVATSNVSTPFVKNLFATVSTPSVTAAATTASTPSVGIFATVSTPSVTAVATSNVSTPSVKNLFATVSTPSATTSNVSTPSVTAATSTVTTPSVGNLFGSPSVTSVASSTVSKPTTTNIFGGNATFATPTGTSIFGGSSYSSNIFGGGSTNPSTTHIFGGSATISQNSTPAANLFGDGTTPSQSLFKTSNQSFFSTGSSIFGKSEAKASQDDGQEGNETVSSSSGKEEETTPVLDCNTGLSFASLAAKVTKDATPAFVPPKAESNNPFAFLGAGAPVFGSKSRANKSTAENDNDEETAEGGAEEEYDPHYEPIIPLPEAIVVSTGEEDESVVFNERAKLYRYDANLKEWKERGVGQLKLLHHPQKNTFRMLLRREQVHKVVLNQLIQPDLDIQPMKISANAWMWAGYNYTDEESALEKLAVRFKNADLSDQFERAVRDLLKRLQDTPKTVEESPQVPPLVPTLIENYEVVEVNPADAPYVYNDDDDSENDEDEDERTVMFTKRCTLFEELNGEWKIVTLGEIQVYYDAELYGARICVVDDNGLQVSNTLIGINTIMDINKNSCTWKAVEFGSDETFYWRTLKATFSSEAAAQEFYSIYQEGHNYAQECDIIDQIPEPQPEEDTE